MPQVVIENPILNSPFDEPKQSKLDPSSCLVCARRFSTSKR
jgi:hypothetical protein